MPLDPGLLFLSVLISAVGLGLFISRALVEAMGGRIWAADAPESGARMSFTLPVHS